MIEGSGAIKIGSCSGIRPMRGTSDTQLTLVRNPSYDARTDSKAARENNPDRFVFVVTGKAVEIVNKLNAGELEDALFFSGPKVLGKYAANARKRGLLRVNPADSVHYMAMNLTQPPFDDVHVRRAMTWVMDKAALRDAWGGPMAGRIPQHFVPDGVLDNRLEGYAPVQDPGRPRRPGAGKAELAKSKYATRNGVCTAKACKRVHLFSGLSLSPSSYAPGERMKGIIMAIAAKLGITLHPSRPKGGPAVEQQPVPLQCGVVEARSGPVELLRSAPRWRGHRPERQPQLLARRDHPDAGGAGSA